jgi:hypothetical protein
MFERQPGATGRAATLPEFEDQLSRGVRATFGELVSRGLNPREAANVTAYLSGLPVSQHAWEVDQVCHLLFLRNLAEKGEFGPLDGSATLPRQSGNDSTARWTV